jgi:dUTP pyrophosphatase
LIVKVKKLEPEARIPTYETADASGIDLYAIEDIVIAPKEHKLIHTGISIEIPKGYEGQIRPRSGLASKYGIGILNSPGTIDADYRGELKVILFNFGHKPFRVHKNDRIAQLAFSKSVRVSLKETEGLTPTKRGSKGFGSTGT